VMSIKAILIILVPYRLFPFPCLHLQKVDMPRGATR